MESFGALEDVDIESVVTAINWNPSEFIEVAWLIYHVQICFVLVTDLWL